MLLKYSSIFLFLSLIVPTALSAQVTVTGPTCVIPGTVYQYLIAGPWDSTSTLQVCLIGGQTADSSQTCTSSGQPRASVLVTWNAPGSGVIQITSTKGNTSLTINVTDTLNPGKIDSASKSQSIVFNGVPATITGSAATGGSCSPAYRYQWQQSIDMLGWQDVDSATGQNLTLTQPLQMTIFVRRKVTETTSGTVQYSDAAVIDVGAPPPGTTRISAPTNVFPELAVARQTPNLKLL
ncbi:MAG TPA: hypothetical protein VN616_12860 [Puia sp.]|nr:hypothetical protein [Puia sp.]